MLFASRFPRRDGSGDILREYRLQKLSKDVPPTETRRHAQPSSADRANCQHDQRSRHGLGRFMNVVLDFMAHPWLPPESQEDEPGHVERGHQRGAKSDQPEIWEAALGGTPRLPEDLVLRK